MKRALYIKNYSRNRSLHRLRTNRHAQIKLSTQQKVMTPTKYRTYQPNAGKADAALSPTGTAKLVRQVGAKAKTPYKSP
jgi:hypothetical protein|tara:strand:- start:119 stop:355 length:237 start_codon:yes stop_codon:yes gene_type:complete